MNDYKRAIELLYKLIDLALTMRNLPKAMDYYGQLGNLYELSRDYKLALIAYKKMLQLAWVNGSIAYEIHAYFGISNQYFYT